MDDFKADLFHLLTSKFICVTKRTGPDMEPAVVFFTTKFPKSYVGYWKKLIRCISYLNQTFDNVSIIGGFNLTEFSHGLMRHMMYIQTYVSK